MGCKNCGAFFFFYATVCLHKRYPPLPPLLFFIAALSVLRSSEEKAPVPQNKFMGDIEELASSYERKLIEVSAVFFLFCLNIFWGGGSWKCYSYVFHMLDVSEGQKKRSNESRLLYIGGLCIARVTTPPP